MKMPRGERPSLWARASSAGNLSERWLRGATAGVCLDALRHGSSLGGRRDELRGRSVLLSTNQQLTAALALIELDGVARRVVLCPPDVPAEHLVGVAATAESDAIIADEARPASTIAGIDCHIVCRAELVAADPYRGEELATEWVLLTSGTTGVPKLVLHTLASLAGAMTGSGAFGHRAVWSTFYDIRRYGGLQIFLRALLSGGSMVLSSLDESVADFLGRAGRHGVTHISGTPSHWRRALMSPAARAMAPSYVRLSGEIADQAILDQLRAVYRGASVAHAFASTEAGVAFDVGDGLAGFPASLIGPRGDVEMKIVEGSLHIRSPRTAARYLGGAAEPLGDSDGFVDTGDMVELRDGRFYFVGRRGGIINVGGLKVHPEEVEAIINRHPGVRMSLVKARRSPITGALVVAEVVANRETGSAGAQAQNDALKDAILAACRRALSPHKVPAAIRFVPSLDVAPSGKLARSGG
jgi:acyl-coenzyme A synthetase/AMP-(fatty) acid ligase